MTANPMTHPSPEAVERAMAHFASFTPSDAVPSHGQTDADKAAGRYSYGENIVHGQTLAAHVTALTAALEQIDGWGSTTEPPKTWTEGDTDAAFSVGYSRAMWDAAEIARKAFGITR